MVVEVMGRYAGWIALHAGIAGGADAILIPEIPFDIEPEAVMERGIMLRERRGRQFSIVVVAEGAAPEGGQRVVRDREVGALPRRVVLGGIGARVAPASPSSPARKSRFLVLGHLQRGGGPPPAFDRLLGLRFRRRRRALPRRGRSRA